MGPRVRASPASLRCVLEQDTGSTQEDQPYIAVRLLMGRKESNQTKKNYVFLSSCLRDRLHLYIYNLDLYSLPKNTKHRQYFECNECMLVGTPRE